MERNLGLKLNKFDPIPHTLRSAAAVNEASSEINVSLAELYHHYYIGSIGRRPPNPDPAHFEYLDLLLPSGEFRARGDGFGASKEARVNRSNELGRAFCRWFLHSHANIVYFANIENVLGKELHKTFGGLSITRTAGGNAPDFFCARDSNRVFLAEAKGSQNKIGFNYSKFSEWRDQFTRVTVVDSNGAARSMKGYIIATQLACEAKPKMNSVLYAEDPETAGEEPLSSEQSGELGALVQTLHYVPIAEKLDQPVLAGALSGNYILPADYIIRGIVWSLRAGPMAGKRFVGGYYPAIEGIAPIKTENDRIIFRRRDPFRLDLATGTFFGVEEQIFKQVATRARTATRTAEPISRLEGIVQFYSAISILRDGSAIGPVEFFEPIDEIIA